MINNLSNRLNIVETATVNTQNQRSNLNTQLSPMEQELFNSLNIPRSRNNTTNTFSHNITLLDNHIILVYTVVIVIVIVVVIYNNLRRQPIRRPESIQVNTEYTTTPFGILIKLHHLLQIQQTYHHAHHYKHSQDAVFQIYILQK